MSLPTPCFVAALQGARSFFDVIQGWRDLRPLTPGYSLQPLRGCRCLNWAAHL